MKSYVYKDKCYDFILSLKAKVRLEQLQNEKLKRPEVARLALGARQSLENITEEQLIALLPYMDELGTIDPVEVGFIILSTYPPYREEMTREFYEGLVDDMDVKLGAEEAFAFFTEVSDEVFTTLARMRKAEEAKQTAQMGLTSIAGGRA